MICPNCQCDNREDRMKCYHCDQDLAMLRAVINRSRNHYNTALEHAERGRDDEALAELHHALELDASFIDAWIV